MKMKKGTTKFVYLLGLLELFGFVVRVAVYFVLAPKHTMNYLMESVVFFFFPAVLFILVAVIFGKRD